MAPGSWFWICSRRKHTAGSLPLVHERNVNVRRQLAPLTHLDAVNLHSVGTLSRRDAVLHFHPRQEVPPEGGAAGLQHLHVHPVGGEANLNELINDSKTILLVNKLFVCMCVCVWMYACMYV